MHMYRNKGGSHHISDTQIIKHGGTFHSADPDLLTKFPNKFEKLTQEAPVAAAPATTAPADAPEGEADDNTNVADGETDVTKEYPAAVAAGLQVLRTKGGYVVKDDGDPLTEKALRNKKAVDKAITEYLKD